MNRNWALSFALADKQQITLGLSGEIGFGFRHMAHRAARQTSRTQSPVRKQRVFFVLGGIYRLTSKVYLNAKESNFWRTYG